MKGAGDDDWALRSGWKSMGLGLAERENRRGGRQGLRPSRQSRQHRQLPPLAFTLAVVIVMGGPAGSYFGSRWFPNTVILRLMAVLLPITGGILIFT